jgi:hypothetical protein
MVIDLGIFGRKEQIQSIIGTASNEARRRNSEQAVALARLTSPSSLSSSQPASVAGPETSNETNKESSSKLCEELCGGSNFMNTSDDCIVLDWKQFYIFVCACLCV